MLSIPPTQPPRQDKILYFAYGANISSKTLLKRGFGAVPPSTVAQIAHPHIALVFGHRGGYATLTTVQNALNNTLENSDVDNRAINFKQPWWQWQKLVADNDSNTTKLGSVGTSTALKDTELIYWQPYGILYELTEEQMQLIEAKEIGYQRKTMSVITTTYSADPTTTASGGTSGSHTKSKETRIKKVDATVFVSDPWMTLRYPVAPSQRYRDLIFQGAIESNLPEEYLNWLRQLPVVVDVAVLGSVPYSDTLTQAALKSIGVGIGVVGVVSVLLGHQ